MLFLKKLYSLYVIIVLRIEYGDCMDLLNKIKNDFDSLTSQDLGIILDNQELTDALIDYVEKNKKELDWMDKIEDENQAIRIFFKEPIFRLFLDSIKKENYIAYFSAIFDIDGYLLLSGSFKKNEEMISVLKKIQDENFDELTQILLSDEEIDFMTSDEKVINFIIDNKLYHRVNCIKITEENASPIIDNFLIETIENTEDIILSIRTPKLLDYCMTHKCVHRIIKSFRYKTPDDLAILKKAFDQDAVVYEQIQETNFKVYLIESPKFILQLLLNGENLTSEQIEYVNNNPELLKQIIEVIAKCPDRIDSNFLNLGFVVLEVRIALIKYNCKRLRNGYSSVLEYRIDYDKSEILELLEKKHDLFMEGVEYLFKSNNDVVYSLADRLLPEENLVEILDLAIEYLSDVRFTELLISKINSNDTKSLNVLNKYIESGVRVPAVTDNSIYSKKMPSTVFINLLKHITVDGLNYIKNNTYNIKENYSYEQLLDIYHILIDICIMYKSDALTAYPNFISSYAREEDVQRVFNHSSELGFNFNDICNILMATDEKYKEKTYEELVSLFNGLIIDYSSFNNLEYIVGENNVEIIDWMLNSPNLVIDNNLFEKLDELISKMDRLNLGEKYREYLKNFYIKIGNIPAVFTFNFEQETIKKATLDSSDDNYIDNIEFFTIKEKKSIDYYILLFNSIKERIKGGKKVNCRLLISCLEAIPTLKSEDVSECIDLELLYWDGKEDSFAKIIPYIDNHLFDKYIREIVIPSLSTHIINTHINELEKLSKLEPDFLNRLNELANLEDKFNPSILKLLNYANRESYTKFLETIYKKDLINYYAITQEFYLITDSLIDTIISDKLIPNLDLLENNISIILEYNSDYDDSIAKQIDNEECLSSLFVIKNAKYYPKVYQALQKALKEGRINFGLNLNNNFLDVNLLKAILEHNENDIKNIVSYLIHHNQNPDKDVFEVLMPYYCKIYNVNLVNFKYIYKEYGNTIIPILESDSFILLCNQDIENIKKLFALLEPRKLDLPMIQGINNSIRQSIFAAKNEDILAIYTTILAKIQNDTFDLERDYYLELLLPAIPNGLTKEIMETFDTGLLYIYAIDKRAFLNHLFDLLKQNQDLYCEVFGAITTNYIILKRNEFSRQDDIFVDTRIPYIYDKKVLYDNLFKKMIQDERRALFKILGIPAYLSYDREYSEDDLDEYAIDYYTIQILSGKDISSKIDKKLLIEVKKNIKVLKEKFNKYVAQKTIDRSWLTNPSPLPDEMMHYLSDPEFESGLKKILIISAREKNLAQELSHLNIEVILKKVIQDDDKYELLLEVIKKYRILDWFDYFSPTINQLSIANQIDDLYGFINAFNRIYDAEMKSIMEHKYPVVKKQAELMRSRGIPDEEIEKYMKSELKIQFNAFKILNICSIYSAIPNCYKVILGLDDFEKVKLNQGDYAAVGYSPEDRLKRACDVHLKAIKQLEVAIPSFITDVELSNKKKLRVIVGNRAHPRNISHGERTGACMRAYGIADSDGYEGKRSNNLFEFCATNFNGFHITFVDPDTDEYVSRVSGFRNGNTVFLNQLRHSVNYNYSDDDVIEAMKLAAQEIILRSKDSELPIENVVASHSLTLANQPIQDLAQNDFGRGVYIGYKDITQYAVVLATTGKNGNHVPLKLDSSKHPHYKCVRVLPREFVGNLNEIEKINLQRITAIRLLLENEDNPDFINGIDIDTTALNDKYVYTIIGQDWFIALDVSGKIKFDIITLDDRAQIEFDEAMEKVEAFKQGKYTMIGGITNGKQF